jgi:hypothetical protein
MFGKLDFGGLEQQDRIIPTFIDNSEEYKHVLS